MLNQVTIQGRFGETPELKTTPNGTNVTSFKLAVQRNYKNANNDYETDWISCVAWRQTAEFICRNFAKGGLIIVTGELETRSYEKDGKKVNVTEVKVNNAFFSGNKGATGGAASAEAETQPPQTPAANADSVPDDDYPF